MKILEDICDLMDPKKADWLVKRIQEDDPEWKYTAIHQEGKLSYIEIRDEKGNFIGKL